MHMPQCTVVYKLMYCVPCCTVHACVTCAECPCALYTCAMSCIPAAELESASMHMVQLCMAKYIQGEICVCMPHHPCMYYIALHCRALCTSTMHPSCCTAGVTNQSCCVPLCTMPGMTDTYSRQYRSNISCVPPTYCICRNI